MCRATSSRPLGFSSQTDHSLRVGGTANVVTALKVGAATGDDWQDVTLTASGVHELTVDANTVWRRRPAQACQE